jgi:hypothetical protein
MQQKKKGYKNSAAILQPLIKPVIIRQPANSKSCKIKYYEGRKDMQDQVHEMISEHISPTYSPVQGKSE